jgi:hypothetical protein
MARIETVTAAARLTSPSRLATALAIIIAPLLLIAFAACGSDDPAEARSVQVNGDKLTWSPPWQAGDARSVTLETDTQLSPALQEQLDALAADVPDLQTQLEDAQSQSLTGTVTFVSVSDNGTVAEYAVPLDAIMDQITDAGLDSENAQMISAMAGLFGQLDLAVEIGIDSSGAVTGVTNLDELTATLSDFMGSLMDLAALSGEDAMDAEERAQMELFLEQLPNSILVQDLAKSAVQMATGQMFLMREGEYTVGQPVIVNQSAPSTFGLLSQSKVTYLLTSVDGGTATMDVTVAPEGLDLVQLLISAIKDFAGMAGEDPDDAVDGLDSIPVEAQPVIDDLTAMFFQPYTVTLTIDTETGWVTSASWGAELSVPQSIIDQFESVSEFGGTPELSLSDISATMLITSTFSPVVAEE